MKSWVIKIVKGIAIAPFLTIIGYFNAFNFLDTKNEKVAAIAFYPERKLKLLQNKEARAEKISTPSTQQKIVYTTKPQPIIPPEEKFNLYHSQGLIKIDDDGIADIKSGKVAKNTLAASILTAEYLKTKGQILHISCFRAGNNFRIHKNGFAFDVSNENIAKILLPWLVQNKEQLKIREIIFDASMIGKSSNYYNYYEGKPHNFNSATIRNHRNHIHVATY